MSDEFDGTWLCQEKVILEADNAYQKDFFQTTEVSFINPSTKAAIAFTAIESLS